jgi:sugar phosphate isomerase/epimerase
LIWGESSVLPDTSFPMETSYSTLVKSYKGLFPFKLGTTSYIYPAPILPNVMSLAPFLDEIELVLFESSGEDNLPDEELIRCLRPLSMKTGVNFNVHLPIDIYLGDQRRAVRSAGVRIVKKFIERMISLSPSTYTLHFSLRDEKGQDAPDLAGWKAHLIESTEEILKVGIGASRISVETLGYPYEWIEDIVKTFGFSICLDLGHLLLKGLDLKSYLDRYLAETSIIHLHGLQEGIDHLGLERLNGETLDLIVSYLRHFQGILSIEIFAFDDLKNSLQVLEGKWRTR